MQKRISYFIIFITTFFSLSLSSLLQAQIIFKELPSYKLPVNSTDIFGISQTRRIINLNGDWTVRTSESNSKPVNVSVPSEFDSNGRLIFEKSFTLNDDINNHTLILHFLGINYSAEFSINNNIIYRHIGGTFPFSFELPKDILKSGADNTLRIKLSHKLSEDTIPLKQRIYFSKNFGGIFRDVFISILPTTYLSDINFTSIVDFKNNTVRLKFSSKFIFNDFRSNDDTLTIKKNYSIKINLKSSDGRQNIVLPIKSFEQGQNISTIINNTYKISNPIVWSPDKPVFYSATIQLLKDKEIIDEVKQKVAILSIKSGENGFVVNNHQFQIKGVTYLPSFSDRGEMASYVEMEDDIRIIKRTGFNSVRFSKSVPHPYFMELCRKYGLLAFIELPLNYIPPHFTSDINYSSNIEAYLNKYLMKYKKYNVVAAFGLGGGYSTDQDSHNSLISNLANIVKTETSFLTYASFSNLNLKQINNLDFFGIELFNKTIVDKKNEIEKLISTLGKGKVFISEATYTVNAGHSNGYTNPFTFEAQAKYFEDLISAYKKPVNSGYFINSMFNYTGDYASLSSGYSDNNKYNIGLIGIDRKYKTLAYKVIYSKFHNTEKVTIPIGSKTDQAPMLFIVFGLVLALGMGVLVNSGKKFREDSSRALLRPYNFFADVRDQRMISGFHTGLLALILSGTSSLLLSNLLFYFKTDFNFERLLISFGSPGLIKTISLLSWNPLMSIIWLTICTAIVIVLIMGIIKSFSLLIKTRVYFSSIYFTVIWSFLPLVLMIPAGIILFRLLNAEIANLNIYLYILIFVFFLWMIHRILKGIYVIFDVNPGRVYFYSFLTFISIFGGILLYYQLKYSLFYFLVLIFN
ncbi:MAG: hypothetical protein IIB07_09910 [Bacteroidetes bacterium]|nr:hypothetical protein [Bacteroidota bacterium]MCH8940982.1 hypothetical protein [Bacteroidota bacterium]